MYPKAVVEALVRNNPDWLNGDTGSAGPFARTFAGHVAETFAVEDWIIGRGSGNPAISEYLVFLRAVKAKFERVKTEMGYWNPNASHSLQHDKWSVGWAGEDLLPIANYLYVLKVSVWPGIAWSAVRSKGRQQPV